MAVADPTNIVTGNARVVRPRLSDARFFFEQGQEERRVTRAMKLGSVVHHNKVGSLGDRAQRLGAIAAFVAGLIGADVARRPQRRPASARLDLLTDMVGEFPELQGIMAVTTPATEGGQTRCRRSNGPSLPAAFRRRRAAESNVSCAVALADKLDALVGFFGIGMVPTGDKDPFGLRRAALGALRILMEKPLPLDLGELIAEAARAFRPACFRCRFRERQLHDFMLDRLRGYLRDAGHRPGRH